MQLRERLAYSGTALGTRSPAPKVAVALPKGFVTGDSRYGRVHYRDQHWPVDHCHGDIPLERTLTPDPVLLERLAPGLDASDIRGAAFLDIETTGLSGGTGTYAFLVGVGTFETYTFRVRQFFLAEPSGESAMLSGVSETVERCRALVTFNGKSFDMPQLATRCALSRLPQIAGDLPHIDLLHPSRRLFGRKLESCRLAEIEREYLGLRRLEDIESWMIPQLYFRYIRARDARGLHSVFEHNTLDVLSLAGLIGALNGVAGAEAGGDAADMLTLAKWDEARGRLADAMRLYEDAWNSDAYGDDGAEAIRRLARLVRRGADWNRCDSLWAQEEATTNALARRIRAKVERAKLAEHRFRDLHTALRLTLEATALLRTPAIASMFPRTSAALAHRLLRLRRRTGLFEVT